MPFFDNYKHIHFTGIAGIGMSGLAEIMLKKGVKVSGSDRTLSNITHKLSIAGATIFQGHAAENIEGADLVVYTSAVSSENPEVDAALKLGVKAVKRAEILAEIMRIHQYSIGVAGTHGKSSTTGMISCILLHAGFDPSVLVGATVDFLQNSNARQGDGKYIVVEADEFDRTFLRLNPSSAVITNLEAEHLDTYKDLQDIKDTFITFANKIPFYGFVWICADEKNLLDISSEISAEVFTYGVDSDAQLQAEEIIYEGRGSKYNLIYLGEKIAEITLNVPGKHNVKNSLGAIGTALKMGIEIKVIADSIAKFNGVDRRFEIQLDSDILLIDDYAHHPTEVAATLRAIRTGWNRRIIAVFQPHLFSRTKDFYKEFADSLSIADLVICVNIYPARELPIQGITSALIIDELRKNYPETEVYYAEDTSKVAELLMDLHSSGDIIVTMGAGDINNQSARFVSLLKERDGK